MSQLEVLTAVRDHNGDRASSNQEYIGGLFFLIALAMVQFCVGIGLIQGYVLPLRRFERVHKIFSSPKVASFIYAFLLSGLYFLISATGGLTGYVVSSGLLLLWAIVIVFIGLIRRMLRRKKEKEDEHAFDNPAEIPDDTQLNESKKPTEIIGNARREIREKSPWASCPAAIAPWQLGSVFINTMLLLLNVMTILLIVYLWEIKDYLVVTPQDDSRIEKQPALAAKALQFMYAYPKVASNLQLDIYVRLFSEYCGTKYHTNLTSDAEKDSQIQSAWVDAYGVNMTEALYPNVHDYASVNDWFTRPLNMQLRPLPTSTVAITSPADCRMTIFKVISDSTKWWFKGYSLNYLDLTGNVVVNGNANYFAEGGMVIARLAPTDYHRFHAPVSGTIVSMKWIPGTLWSVSADAVGSGNQVMLNQRWVVVIDAGSTIGYVAYVAIGATCVGSVVMQTAAGVPLAPGSFLQQGDQMGIMQFGGSTVVVLFSKEIIVFDSDILYRSSFPVETLVKVNQQIGQARS